MISRFESIINHRVFKDFRWPEGLNNFSRFNLIYGWNGSGKTTLANLFRAIEKGELLHEGEFTVNINGNRVSSKSISSYSLPYIRVFNEKFVTDNVFTIDGSVSPIFVLGESNVDKQKKIEELKQTLREKQAYLEKLEEEAKIRESALDDFCKDMGKNIKQLLSSSGINPYNSYTKRNFLKKAEELCKDTSYTSRILTDLERDKLKKVIVATPKEKVSLVQTRLPELNFFAQQTSGIMEKTVLSQTMIELKSDPDLAQWVKEGMEQHNRKLSSSCLFCGQPLPPNRMQRLEAHFSHQYTAFITEIDNLMELIQSQIDELSFIKLPDKAALNDHLTESYLEAQKNLESDITKMQTVLKELLGDLKKKRGNVFERLNSFPPAYTSYSDPIAKINEIIQQHNHETRDFQSMVTTARTRLEESIVAESLDSYMNKKRNLTSAQVDYKECQSSYKELENSLKNLEASMINHRQPADELNKDLQFYLGHDNLRFAARDTGYQIMRKNQLATELSQGEKTAIAFLYFLKSLDSKDFDRRRGIVVIDDPISSLDANSLFHAFSFMKDRTHNVGQLIVLTHNLQFFRQVKGWFKNDKRINESCSYYMLKCSLENGTRCSQLMPLDDLLLKYDSEYHYLFSLVFQHANLPSTKLDSLYYMPNIARRLLEAFLAFKRPVEAGNFYRQLKCISKDHAKVTRVYNFLNSFSHNNAIDEPEHDSSVLTETPQILADILSLIREEDEGHYNQLVELTKPVKERYVSIG